MSKVENSRPRGTGSADALPGGQGFADSLVGAEFVTNFDFKGIAVQPFQSVSFEEVADYVVEKAMLLRTLFFRMETAIEQRKLNYALLAELQHHAERLHSEFVRDFDAFAARAAKESVADGLKQFAHDAAKVFHHAGRDQGLGTGYPFTRIIRLLRFALEVAESPGSKEAILAAYHIPHSSGIAELADDIIAIGHDRDSMGRLLEEIVAKHSPLENIIAYGKLTVADLRKIAFENTQFQTRSVGYAEVAPAGFKFRMLVYLGELLKSSNAEGVRFTVKYFHDLKPDQDEQDEDDTLLMPGAVRALEELAIKPIIVNAVDAMDGCSKKQIDMLIDHDHQRGFWRIGISNSGPAIPPEMFEKIFEEGVSSSGQTNRGRGLALARKQLRESFGDKADIFPEEVNDGARFVIEIADGKPLDKDRIRRNLSW